MATCIETGLSPSYGYKLGCRCTVCKETKAKYTFKERDKARQRAKLWQQNNKDRNHELKMKWARNQSYLKYKELVDEFGRVCAICGASENNGKLSSSARLHKDHDHKTGKIRGLLCGNCNVGIGHFKDDIHLLIKAIEYLKKNNV